LCITVENAILASKITFTMNEELDHLEAADVYDTPLPDSESWELAGVGAEDLLDALDIKLSDAREA
jgi:hypothetical protein